MGSFPCSRRWRICIAEGIQLEEVIFEPAQNGKVLVVPAGTAAEVRAVADPERHVVELRPGGSEWRIRLPAGVHVSWGRPDRDYCREGDRSLIVDTGHDNVHMVALVEPHTRQIALLKGDPPPDADLSAARRKPFEPGGTKS
jgi:hypothetical protein